MWASKSVWKMLSTKIRLSCSFYNVLSDLAVLIKQSNRNYNLG